jgi:hypothetical protein
MDKDEARRKARGHTVIVVASALVLLASAVVARAGARGFVPVNSTWKAEWGAPVAWRIRPGSCRPPHGERSWAVSTSISAPTPRSIRRRRPRSRLSSTATPAPTAGSRSRSASPTPMVLAQAPQDSRHGVGAASREESRELLGVPSACRQRPLRRRGQSAPMRRKTMSTGKILVWDLPVAARPLAAGRVVRRRFPHRRFGPPSRPAPGLRSARRPDRVPDRLGPARYSPFGASRSVREPSCATCGRSPH